jgi:hypothetical protein
MQFLDHLTILMGSMGSRILKIQERKMTLENIDGWRRRMLKVHCTTVELTQAAIDADLTAGLSLGEEGFCGGLDGLNASVKGRGVNAINGWVDFGEMGGELMGLFDAGGSQFRVRRDTGGRLVAGGVDTGLRVYLNGWADLWGWLVRWGQMVGRWNGWESYGGVGN